MINFANMSKEKKYLFLIIVLSAALRTIFAAFTELSNDEALYRILALFPALSYHAHPPMVAWLARLTTLGASVAPEFLVRLSSIIIGTINTYIVYKIVHRVTTDEKCGVIAALLYTGSAYASIFIGITLLPDGMLSLCWLLALDIMLILIQRPNGQFTSKEDILMLCLGLVIGVGTLSKYTAGYLSVAWVLYILIYDRKWLTRWSLWSGGILAILIFSPVIIWNVNHDFISISSQTQRLLNFNEILWWSPWRELAGNFGYQNPINWIVFILAIIFFTKNKEKISRPIFRLLLITSLPMILLFFVASFTQPTLPHWSAPAYFSLIILAALYLKEVKFGYKIATVSASLLAILLIIAGIEIKYEPISIPREQLAEDIGKNDITLDMYGWKQGGEKFAEIYRNDIERGNMKPNANIVHDIWYEGAHLDNYFALPLGLTLLTYDGMDYEAISNIRGGIQPGSDAYFISSSRTYVTPYKTFGEKYSKIDTPEIINIMRNNNIVEKFYIYRLHNAK